LPTAADTIERSGKRKLLVCASVVYPTLFS
jgi:hypothetical protein